MRRVQKRLHEIHSFGWKWQRGKKAERVIYLDGIRETTTDPCYRHIDLEVYFLGFVGKIIWIHNNSISISWFWSDKQDSTSRFRNVQSLCLTTQLSVFPLDSAEKCLSLTAEKMLVSPSADDCFSSGTKNEFGFPAEFSAASNHLRQAKPTYLVSGLESGFCPQTTQNSIHHLS